MKRFMQRPYLLFPLGGALAMAFLVGFSFLLPDRLLANDLYSTWRKLKDVTYQETHRRFENGQWSQPITRTMQMFLGKMFLGKRLASVVLLLVGKRRGASGVPSAS